MTVEKFQNMIISHIKPKLYHEVFAYVSDNMIYLKH